MYVCNDDGHSEVRSTVQDNTYCLDQDNSRHPVRLLGHVPEQEKQIENSEQVFINSSARTFKTVA